MVRVIPLGGLGEIGLNAMVFETGDEMVLVDCGLMFPRDNLPGVDIIVPDFQYLRANAHKLKGVIITHAHEDHLGAVPYLLREGINVPVFAPKFATHLLRYKMEELDVDTDVHEIGPGESFKPSPNFEIEPVRMCHSLPDALGHLIKTPESTFFHTGDWKIDESPLDGWKTDLERLERAGDEGLTGLFSDSTNSEVHVHNPSEAVVAETFDRLFANDGRVIVSMFASHVGRIQTVIDLCVKHGRKLLLSGRTLQRNVEIGQKTGHLKVPPNLLIELKDAGYFPPKLLCMLVTGSQAEPRSHLVQMGGKDFPLKFEKTDLVILSARAIPGNETAIGALIDRILAHGANVAYWRNEPGVHVSGHASSVEQTKLIKLLKPRNMVPIHGELRHLHAHHKTANGLGVRATLATDGDVIRFDGDKLTIDGKVSFGRSFRDRDGMGEVPEAVLREREKLSLSCIVMVVVVVDRATGRFVMPSNLQSRGATEEESRAVEQGSAEVQAMLEETSPVLRGDDAFLKEEVVRAVRKLFKLRGLKRPTVMPAIVKL